MACLMEAQMDLDAGGYLLFNHGCNGIILFVFVWYFLLFLLFKYIQHKFIYVLSVIYKNIVNKKWTIFIVFDRCKILTHR